MNPLSTKSTTLTGRQKEIIRILASYTQDSPATAADIAQALDISTRTVLREMPTIERWLTENQFQFLRKPGVGLALVGQLSQLTELLEGFQPSQGYSKEERRHHILSELLSAQQPIKSQTLTRAMQVSEGTLVHDLDYARDWLSTYKVTLHRRPGLGVYLEGAESSLRHAMVGVLLEDLQERVALELVEGANALLQPSSLSQVADALTAVAKTHSLHYTDRGYMSLALYLAVSARRIAQGHLAEDVSSTHDLTEFPVATDIAGQLGMPWQEVYWIARELVGAIFRQEDGQAEHQLDSLPIRQLVLKLIGQVEERLGQSFGENQMLVEDLIRHMEPALCRLQMAIPVKNTHIQEIQSQYPQIYQATESACQLFCQPTGASQIPDSEIAFIAMHFCAAAERQQTVQRKIKAVIVCPTGVGMSRILAANLSKYFKQIDIHSVVSAMRLAPDWLSDQGIDLVISTVKLSLDYPNLCVHPGLRPQDRALIGERCNQLASQPLRTVSQSPQPSLRSTIDYVEALGQEILRLSSRVVLQVLDSVEDKGALIEAASQLFTQGEFAQGVIRTDLEAREAISQTYIPEGEMLLLHCRTTAVTTSQLGYIRLERPLMLAEGRVTGAIVMLVHQNPATAHAELMGQISAAFLDNQQLYLAVQQGTRGDFAREVEGILGRYYRSVLRQIAE